MRAVILARLLQPIKSLISIKLLKSMNTKEILQLNKYENEILELIDNQDEFTRSDFQARVQAVVLNIVRGGVEL